MANWNTRCAPARMPPITSKRITETKKAIREKDGLFHFGLQRFISSKRFIEISLARFTSLFVAFWERRGQSCSSAFAEQEGPSPCSVPAGLPKRPEHDLKALITKRQDFR